MSTSFTSSFRIGTAGVSSLQNYYLTQTQSRLNDLSVQLSTNRVSTRFSGIAVNADRVVNLEAEIVRREAYIKTIDAQSIRLSTQNLALDGVVDTVRDFLGQLANVANSPTPPDIQQLADGAIRQVADFLNTRDGTRYVFSGTNGAQTSAPVDLASLLRDTTGSANVGDLPNLTLAEATATFSFTSGAAGDIALAGDLPATLAQNTVGTVPAGPVAFSRLYYQVGLSNAVPANDLRRFNESRQVAQVADNIRLDVGINADEVGFQRALRVLSFFQRFPEGVPSQTARVSDATIQSAIAELQLAKTEISDAQGRAASQLQQLAKIEEDQRSFINLAEGSRDTILLPDTGTTAVLIGNFSNQLQASYAAIAQLRNLTLVNYIR